MKLKENFLWGGALSNVQAEGHSAHKENVYDDLIVVPEKGQNSQGDTNIAANHFVQFEEDIELMKEAGFKAYRFSIVWSRIHPNGTEEYPDSNGLEYYDRMVDALLANDIIPVVSLVHFDMPSYLQKTYNGFLDKKVIDLYLKHVEQVVEHFKDRVSYWITYNEINTAPFDSMSYLVAGAKRPSDTSKEQFYHDIVYNTQLASAKAINIIKKLSPESKVSGMITLNKVYPKRNDPYDRLASQYINKFNVDLFTELMCLGEYPSFYKKFLKLNNIDFSLDCLEDLKKASKNIDFLSISCYQTRVIETSLKFKTIADINQLIFESETEENPSLDSTHWGWTIDPVGFREELNELYGKYHLPLFVVENGIGLVEKDSLEENLRDQERIDYHNAYVYNMMQAILVDGVDIMGYLLWTPIDILSSHKEMEKRYGLIYVDKLQNGKMKRIKKDSFYWYKQVISSNGDVING